MVQDLEFRRAEVTAEWLEQIRVAAHRLRVRQRELFEERELASGLTGLDYTKPFVMTSAYGDAIPDSLARLLAMEDAYRTALDELTAMRADARSRLAKMGGRYSDLLRLRYVSALPWNTVAEGMGLSKGTCRNMNRIALSCFFDYIPPEQKIIFEKNKSHDTM